MSDRAQRLQERLPEAGVDALLVTELVNLRYLTGYSGSNGLALVGPRQREFVTDFRYVEQAAQEVDSSFTRHQGTRDLLAGLPDLLARDGSVALGFEEAHVSVRNHRRLRELLPERVELVATEDLVEGLRAVKAPEELQRIHDATALADAAFSQVLADGLVGRSEREVALALEQAMRRSGAQRPSFESIVAAAGHGALPHYHPGSYEIAAGDLVVIDWGAELDGYCSDCTRTVAAGAPSPSEREVYELVLAAQREGVAAVSAGADCRAVDGRAREVIADGGYGEQFGHGLGHGVGLEVHEAPTLSRTASGTLAAGNVVTVEPGVYLSGRFGVRIEDLVAVTGDGCETFTSIDKTLTVVN